MVLKRTQRDDEDCIEPRKTLTVEAEALRTAAGNMCGTAMRGLHRGPVRAVKDRVGTWEAARSRQGGPGSVREGEEPKPDRKVGGGCRVPMKPRTIPADRQGAESVEGRVEGRVRANACSGHRAGTRMSPTACVHGPELEPKPRMRLTFDRSPVRESVRREKRRGETPPPAGEAGREAFGVTALPYCGNILGEKEEGGRGGGG